MAQDRNCTNCGAAPSQDNLRFCGFCGTELPVLDPGSQFIGKPMGDLDSRFEALEKHPSVPELLKHRPRTSGRAASMASQGVFGVVFTVMAVFMTGVFGVFGGPLAVVPLLFIVVGVFITISGFKKSAEYSSAPLQRFRAGVVDERIKVSGGGENSSSRTQYFATLQAQDGKRSEYEVDEETAAVIAPGDVGIAYAKARFLLDFTRVDV